MFNNERTKIVLFHPMADENVWHQSVPNITFETTTINEWSPVSNGNLRSKGKFETFYFQIRLA